MSEMELRRLAEPFPADAIEWRVGQCGLGQNGQPWCKVLAYVTNRAIMDRLDEVCGPENWQNEFREWHPGRSSEAQVCRIGVRVGDVWVWKEDGADNTDVESTKGGLSSAMKRAAVQWGIGRYLYDLPEGWADSQFEKPNNTDGWNFASGKDKKTNKSFRFWWRVPALPKEFLPVGAENPRGRAESQLPPDDGDGGVEAAAEPQKPVNGHAKPSGNGSASVQTFNEGDDWRKFKVPAGDNKGRTLDDISIKEPHLIMKYIDAFKEKPPASAAMKEFEKALHAANLEEIPF